METPEMTATVLRQLYGTQALLQAAVCGHEALAANDVEQCQFWRSVMDCLGAEQEKLTSATPSDQ